MSQETSWWDSHLFTSFRKGVSCFKGTLLVKGNQKGSSYFMKTKTDYVAEVQLDLFLLYTEL